MQIAKRVRTLVVGLAILLLMSPSVQGAQMWTDGITTTTTYNLNQTSAVVNTNSHEIYLPSPPNSLAIHHGTYRGLTYSVLNGNAIDTYSWTGTAMVLNSALSIPAGTVSNPLGLAILNGDDLAVLTATGARIFQSTGSGMAENPQMAIAGLSNPLTIAQSQGAIFAGQGAAVKAFTSTGQGYVENPSLELNNLPANALAIGAPPDRYDLGVVQGSSVEFYSSTGAGLTENPYLALTGLSQPMAIAADDGKLDVLDSGQEKSYQPTGSGWAYAGVLSAGGLTTPTTVAMVPNTNDVLVLDGSTVRYYAFTGGGMQEDAAFEVSGVTRTYVTGQPVQSVFHPVSGNWSAVELSAKESTPSGSSINYWVTANAGTNWTPITLGQGVTVPAGNQIGWKAVLNTPINTATPMILPNIVLGATDPPNAPTNLTESPMDAQGNVNSQTPTLSWTFSSSDPSQTQSGFQVEIFDAGTNQLLYNSGKISSLANPAPPPDGSPLTADDPAGAQSQIKVPTGVLDGHYAIKWQVRVWDNWDLISPWASTTFDLFDLYDLAVTAIVDPPSPDPNPPLPTTNLPVSVKAGADFTFQVQSTGPIDSVSATFSDGGNATLTPSQSAGSTTNTWTGTYYTNGNTPTGTTIDVTLTGIDSVTGETISVSNVPIVITDGSIYSDFFMILSGGGQ